MNIQIEAKIIRDALSQIITVVDRKNPRAILTYSLFKISHSDLIIEATDLEVSTRLKIPCSSDESGEFCVNPKNLLDLIREMPDKLITFNLSSETKVLNISCDKINISLLVSETTEFPKLNFEEEESNLKINSHSFLNLINKTSHAISHDETRIFLNGIFLQTHNGSLRAVATNGYTFALIDTNDFEANTTILDNGVIIPRKGVSELKKILELYSDSNLIINLNESFIYITIEDKVSLAVRLIARDYVPYQTVIPSKTQFSFHADREQLLTAIKRVKIMANEKSNAIRFSLSNDELVVSANHPTLGEAKETISVDFNGESIDIGFNARYVLDSLSVFEKDEVNFEFNNELSPVLLKSQQLNEFLGIIMPLKL